MIGGVKGCFLKWVFFSGYAVLNILSYYYIFIPGRIKSGPNELWLNHVICRLEKQNHVQISFERFNYNKDMTMMLCEDVTTEMSAFRTMLIIFIISVNTIFPVENSFPKYRVGKANNLCPIEL